MSVRSVFCLSRFAPIGSQMARPGQTGDSMVLQDFQARPCGGGVWKSCLAWASCRPVRVAALAAVGAGLMLVSAAPSRADERLPPITHAATLKECGDCHMVFQPGLLPAGSWSRLMETLDKHFGENASLPAETAAEITAYLTSHAGRSRKDDRSEPPLRITETRWWMKEHRLSPAQWERSGARTKADCKACHTMADQGLYED